MNPASKSVGVDAFIESFRAYFARAKPLCAGGSGSLGEVTADPALCVQLTSAVSAYDDIVSKAETAVSNAEKTKGDADQTLLTIRMQAGIDG